MLEKLCLRQSDYSWCVSVCYDEDLLAFLFILTVWWILGIGAIIVYRERESRGVCWGGGLDKVDRWMITYYCWVLDLCPVWTACIHSVSLKHLAGSPKQTFPHRCSSCWGEGITIMAPHSKSNAKPSVTWAPGGGCNHNKGYQFKNNKYQSSHLTLRNK